VTSVTLKLRKKAEYTSKWILYAQNMEIMVLHLDIPSVGADIYMQSVPYPLAGVVNCAAKGHQLTKSMCRLVADSFYRAMPGMRGTSRGPVSVCLSVCVRHNSVFY